MNISTISCYCKHILLWLKDTMTGPGILRIGTDPRCGINHSEMPEYDVSHNQINPESQFQYAHGLFHSGLYESIKYRYMPCQDETKFWTSMLYIRKAYDFFSGQKIKFVNIGHESNVDHTKMMCRQIVITINSHINEVNEFFEWQLTRAMQNFLPSSELVNFNLFKNDIDNQCANSLRGVNVESDKNKAQEQLEFIKSIFKSKESEVTGIFSETNLIPSGRIYG